MRSIIDIIVAVMERIEDIKLDSTKPENFADIYSGEVKFRYEKEDETDPEVTN